MLRRSGRVVRLAEAPGSPAAVQPDGVLYEAGRVLSILTADVVEMVQQQGGGAERVDYLGENVLVEGMLFDDFKAAEVFEIADPDGDADAVTLEILEPRAASALERGQLGDDEGKRRSIAGILAMAPGFSGWTARVVAAGRVCAGFQIAKRNSPAPEA